MAVWRSNTLIKYLKHSLYHPLIIVPILSYYSIYAYVEVYDITADIRVSMKVSFGFILLLLGGRLILEGFLAFNAYAKGKGLSRVKMILVGIVVYGLSGFFIFPVLGIL